MAGGARTGKRRNKDNVRARVIAPAVRRANELREAAGGTPLPAGVTPHTLRHTFISFLLEAEASPRHVMGQVGHRDPKTTLRIYAHLLKRDRSGVGEGARRTHPRERFVGASSTNLGGWINKAEIWWMGEPRAPGRAGRLRQGERDDWFADDSQTLVHWHETPAGRHIELGIAHEIEHHLPSHDAEVECEAR